jgi:predicted dehydrogenase
MIKTALIGHGYWGSMLLRYLKADKRFSVKHICDSKTNLAQVWPKVEAVVVATPIETHYQVVKKALLQKKHVFSEKPLALKTKECLELKKIAKENQVVLAVEYTQTFSRALKKAQTIDVGAIKAIEMSVKHLGRFLNHDVYWLLASHCLSILDMFVPLEKLQFQRQDFLIDRGLAETGQILFSNKQIKGSISLSLNFPGKEYQVIIYGARGTIIFDTMAESSLKAVWYKKTPMALPPGLTIKEKSWKIDEKNNLKYAVDYFYKVLKGREKTNLERAIKVTEVLEKLSTKS